MHRRTRWLLILLAAVGCLVIVAGVIIGLQWWNLFDKIRSVEWYETATPAEMKATAEQLLWFPPLGHHDAFIILIDYGDVDSIPSLMQGLWWQPNTPKGGAMVCTKLHCLEALRKITGHNAGRNYSDWRDWWDSVGRRLPAADLPLKEADNPAA
jgi:hypothetical protein